jgi:undecaprenyl diphosphate synthase
MPPRHDNAAPLGGLDDEALFEKIRAHGNLPRHVAIIMDGNGRWARRRYLPRVAGHRAGRHAVRRCVRISSRLGIEILTLYTFSNENFNRPAAEVSALWTFLEETLATERDELNRRDVQLRATGELDRLPTRVREVLNRTIEELATNDGLVVNLAIAYGGRQEILRAASRLAQRIASGEISATDVTEAEFRRELYSPDLPDPDLVIRTSGEARLSNFLLWQSAYSELFITPVLWPDFGEREFLSAVHDFQRRERRFGALPEAGGEDAGGGDASFLDASRWKRLLKVRP